MEEKTLDVIVSTTRNHTRKEWLDEYIGSIEGEGFKIEYRIRFNKPYLDVIQDEHELLESTELEVVVNEKKVEEPEDISRFKKLIPAIIYQHIGYFETAFGREGAPFRLSDEAEKHLPEPLKEKLPSEEDAKMLLLSATTLEGRNRLMRCLAEVKPTLTAEYKVILGPDVQEMLERYAA